MIWGKVTKVSDDNTVFYIDDGSGRTTDGFAGIKVILAGANVPVPDSFVVCTGISRMIDGAPVLQMRDGGDLIITRD